MIFARFANAAFLSGISTGGRALSGNTDSRLTITPRTSPNDNTKTPNPPHMGPRKRRHAPEPDHHVSNGNWCDYGQLMGDTFCGKSQTFPLSEMGPVVWPYMPEGG